MPKSTKATTASCTALIISLLSSSSTDALYIGTYITQLLRNRPHCHTILRSALISTCTTLRQQSVQIQLSYYGLGLGLQTEASTLILTLSFWPQPRPHGSGHGLILGLTSLASFNITSMSFLHEAYILSKIDIPSIDKAHMHHHYISINISLYYALV